MTLLIFLLALLAPSLAVHREYIFVNKPKNWTEAKRYCRENYNDLATIDNREDFARVAEMVKDTGFRWIGAYDAVKSWRWSVDNAPLYDGGNVSLGGWFVFNANNSKLFEHCAYVSGGALADDLCESVRPSVCQDGGSYVPVATPMTWTSARSHCRRTHTDLASVRSRREMSAVMAVIDGGEWWVGLSRDGWGWSDLTDSPVTMWRSRQPNGAGDHCGAFTRSGFCDRPCSEKSSFFCSVFHRRIFKIVMKTTGSGDLNDPQVQEAVMKHLGKHMSEEGRRQFKLMWKKQASRNISNRMEL